MFKEQEKINKTFKINIEQIIINIKIYKNVKVYKCQENQIILYHME